MIRPSLFEQVLASTEHVRTAGRRAIAELKAAGAPAYYVEKPHGPLIKELPDGTRIVVASRDQGRRG